MSAWGAKSYDEEKQLFPNILFWYWKKKIKIKELNSPNETKMFLGSDYTFETSSYTHLA